MCWWWWHRERRSSAHQDRCQTFFFAPKRALFSWEMMINQWFHGILRILRYRYFSLMGILELRRLTRILPSNFQAMEVEMTRSWRTTCLWRRQSNSFRISLWVSFFSNWTSCEIAKLLAVSRSTQWNHVKPPYFVGFSMVFPCIFWMNHVFLMSFAQLSKPKSKSKSTKSTKATKPRSDGSDEDQARFVGFECPLKNWWIYPLVMSK